MLFSKLIDKWFCAQSFSVRIFTTLEFQLLHSFYFNKIIINSQLLLEFLSMVCTSKSGSLYHSKLYTLREFPLYSIISTPKYCLFSSTLSTHRKLFKSGHRFEIIRATLHYAQQLYQNLTIEYVGDLNTPIHIIVYRNKSKILQD